jgi:hypothetical protein
MTATVLAALCAIYYSALYRRARRHLNRTQAAFVAVALVAVTPPAFVACVVLIIVKVTMMAIDELKTTT